MESLTNENTSQGESDYYSIVGDGQIDYYTLYYDGDIESLNSVWSREPHFVPLVSLYTSCFLCGVTGNGIVLFAIIGSKKTRNVTFSFMLSLAVADLLFLLVCIPIDTLGMILGNWAGGVVFCKLSGFAEMLSAVSSILNLSTISVERYVLYKFHKHTLQKYLRPMHIILNMLMNYALRKWGLIIFKKFRFRST